MDKAAVILTAGKSTRMKSDIPKALHPLLGKPVIAHIIDNCKRAGFERVILVIGHKGEMIRERIGNEIEYVEQEEPTGTAHALLSTRKILSDFKGVILTIYGDVCLVPPEVIKDMLKLHIEKKAQCTLLSADLPGTIYGKIIRDEEGKIKEIIEPRGLELPPEIEGINEVNAGVYLFEAPLIFHYLEKVGNDNPQKEFYLTDVVGLLYQDGFYTQAIKLPQSWMAKGINDRKDLVEVAKIMRENIIERLLREGVTVEDPQNTYIEATVEIERDVIVHPFTFIKGKTRIAKGCEIGPFAYVEDCEIGEGTKVIASFLQEAKIGRNCLIGPFARLRTGTILEDEVGIGNFVEVKNSLLEKGVKAMHLAYLGDAFVGEGTNIGAGTITCNFDGEKKNKTYIGKNVFVGSDTIFIAPVEIGEGAYIAAGSVINQNVPPYALAIARERQTIKEEWVIKRKKKSKEDV
ncbi:MAG: bifunctional UDP-N-acetylglucosamine diphosphorylase/glucosamine-1-phosphate N-acetyltransferase GlmU [bacterium]